MLAIQTAQLPQFYLGIILTLKFRYFILFYPRLQLDKINDINASKIHLGTSTGSVEFCLYRSFVTYRTRFSQVFSNIIQLRRKDSQESCVTF